MYPCPPPRFPMSLCQLEVIGSSPSRRLCDGSNKRDQPRTWWHKSDHKLIPERRTDPASNDVQTWIRSKGHGPKIVDSHSRVKPHASGQGLPALVLGGRFRGWPFVRVFSRRPKLVFGRPKKTKSPLRSVLNDKNRRVTQCSSVLYFQATKLMLTRNIEV